MSFEIINEPKKKKAPNAWAQTIAHFKVVPKKGTPKYDEMKEYYNKLKTGKTPKKETKAKKPKKAKAKKKTTQPKTTKTEKRYFSDSESEEEEKEFAKARDATDVIQSALEESGEDKTA